MIVGFKKQFIKSYQKLSLKKQQKVDNAIATFQKDPFNESLKNHALKGELKNCRSISAGGGICG